VLPLTGWRQRPAATVAVLHEERGGRSNCWPLHLQSVRPYQFGRNPIPSPSIAQSSHVSNADGLQATAGSSGVPHYQLDRSEEDCSGLCRQANGSDDFWDPLKCIGLGRPFWYVSFGAELRGSYEVYRNYNWGSGPQDGNGYYLNRLISDGDFHFGPSVRIFAELQSGLEFGRNGGPRPAIDEDKLDVSQLFLELRSSTCQHKVPIEVRVGRQDLNYGDGSLVSIRDLNVRRPFDGIKLILRPHDWGIDVFAAKPVVTSPGFFDDAPDLTRTFWGIWATDKKEQSFVRQLDLYYLGLDRKNGQFDQGAAHEQRNTLGVRAHETASKMTRSVYREQSANPEAFRLVHHPYPNGGPI
jgi:Alginate export